MRWQPYGRRGSTLRASGWRAASCRRRKVVLLLIEPATGGATTAYQLRANIEAEIAAWVLGGGEADIPATPQALLAWQGVGTLLTDPSTGQARYQIAGALSGGMTALPAHLMPFLKDVLDPPSSAGVTMDPRDTATIEIWDGNFQEAEVDSVLRAASGHRPLRVVVRDTKDRAVVGAQVDFVVVDGGGSIVSDPGLATTNYLGVAVAWLHLGSSTTASPYYRRAHPDDDYATQYGMNVVVARIGRIQATRPFYAFGRPGPLAKLVPWRQITSLSGQPNMSLGGMFGAIPEDRFDNPLANLPVTFESLAGVSSTPEQGPALLRSSEICRAGAIIGLECGGAASFTETGPFTGVTAMLVLGPRVDRTYQVKATADGPDGPLSVTFVGVPAGEAPPGQPQVVVSARHQPVSQDGQIAEAYAIEGLRSPEDPPPAPLSASLVIIQQRYRIEPCAECAVTGYRIVGTGEYATTRVISSATLPSCGGDGSETCGGEVQELHGRLYFEPADKVADTEVRVPDAQGDFVTQLRGLTQPGKHAITTKARAYLPVPIIRDATTGEVEVCRVGDTVCGAKLEWGWHPAEDVAAIPGPSFTIWAVGAALVPPVPRLILDSDQLTRGERKIPYEVSPANYPAFSVSSEITENGHVMVMSSTPGLPALPDRFIHVSQGLFFDKLDGQHEVHLILNDGWTWPYQGQQRSLAVHFQPPSPPIISVVRVDITYERTEMPYLEIYGNHGFQPNPAQARSDILISTTPPTQGLPIVICSTRLGETTAAHDPAGHLHPPEPPSLPLPPAPLDPVDVTPTNTWPTYTLETSQDTARLVYYAWGGFSYPKATTEQVKELRTVTNPVGQLDARYHAPAFSGKEVIVVDIDGTPTASGSQFEKHVDVRWPNLVEMEAGPGFQLIGSVLRDGSRPHFYNHFGTPQTIVSLGGIADAYHALFPADPVLQYNDMSLPWGGLFDIGPTTPGGALWQRPHTWEHRQGTSCDLRRYQPGGGPAIPPANLLRLDRILQQWHSEKIPETDHYHIRLPHQ